VKQTAPDMGFFPALRYFRRSLHAFTASSRVDPSVSRGKRDAADCLNISMIVRMETGTLQRRLDEAHRRFYLMRSLWPTYWKFYSLR
jgi:hypothetical protein